jgi:hypothetical protein
MNEPAKKTPKSKPFWRTPSEYNPAVTWRSGLAYGGVCAVIFAAVLAPFVLHDVAGVSLRTASIAVFVLFGAVLGLLEVAWLVLLAFGIPREVRRSNALWRERMASGFYEKLPPIKDDDDD